MKPYSKYKKSGIDWVGEIPEHWKKKDLNHIPTNERYSFTGGPFGSDLKHNEYTESGVRIIQLQNIGVGNFLNGYKIYTSEGKADALSSCNIFPGEIIIAKMADPVARACKMPSFDKRYLMASDGIRLKVNEKKFNTDFVVYSLNSSYFKYQAELHSSGSTRLRIGLGTLKKLKFITPPVEEQTAIANFLDHKTAQIDGSIEKRRELIDLLKEHRAAIINEAVTKGINPDASMKDSGIEWIGEIPEHWECWKVSRGFEKISSGTTPKSGDPKYHENGTINWINTGDLNDGILNSCKKKITLKALEDHSTLKIYPPNSLIVAMYGATIGKTSITTFEATTNQACCVLANSNVFEVKFAFYWFIANKQHIINMSFGGGQPNISQEIIRTLKIPTPPKEEQILIIKNIEIQTAHIDQEIQSTQREIDLLKEYRQSLIAEAVTGKIDVRDYPLN